MGTVLTHPTAVMTEVEAKQIFTRINLLIGAIAENTEKVVALIEQAKEGEAWKALDYKSWTACVSAECSASLAGLQRADRVPIVAMLSDAGMSTRAIAPVVGISQGQVVKDLAQVIPKESPAGDLISLDGKTYPRQTKLAPKTPRRRPFPDAYEDAVWDLQKAVERVQRLHQDDRFAANRDAIKRNNSLVTRMSILLSDLENEMTQDLTCAQPGCDRPRAAAADYDEMYCGNCRRYRAGEPGPCEYCGAQMFTDCTCDVG